MSKGMTVSILVLLLTFLSGLGMGLYFGGSSTFSEASAPRTGAASGQMIQVDGSRDAPANTVLSSRIRELNDQIARQNAKDAAASLDRLAFFKKFRTQLNITPFNSGLEVSPEMAALLGLTEAERNQIQQDLRDAKGVLDKMQDADTKVTSQSDHNVSLTVNSDKAGTDLKQQLRDQLASELGDDRADIFMSESWSWNESFSNFMNAKRQVDLEWQSDKGPPSYKLSTQYFNADGTPSGNSSQSGGGFPAEYQKYLPQETKP